jgi:flagellar biosynthetic protein FliR
MIDRILADAPGFLLIAVRCFALIMTLPLFSIKTVSRSAKIALAGYMSFLILPQVNLSVYAPYIGRDGAFSLEYILLLGGEAMIGVITGFYVSIIFSAFSTAGQFFAFQMGFSASEVYDALSQVENPLLGQFLNLIAMLIFLQNRWAQRLFTGGLIASFKTLTAFSLVTGREKIIKFLVGSLTELFADAFVIALPILGTLLLITIAMGLLSKAAPQMNLMADGFSIMLLTAFFIIMALMPQLCDYFTHSFSAGFEHLEQLFIEIAKTGGTA